jgi:hypothetical protein
MKGPKVCQHADNVHPIAFKIHFIVLIIVLVVIATIVVPIAVVCS